MTHPPPPLSVLFGVTATSMMGNALLSAAAPDIVDHFGQPASAIGWIFAAVALPGIVVAPLIGQLADRFGRKEVLLPCLMVFGVGGCLGAFSPNFAVFLATRVLMGFGAAGLINLSLVIIADSWAGNERSRRIGWNSAVVTTCLALFPFTGGLLTEAFGWRGPFLPFVLVFVVAAAVAVSLDGRGAPEPVAGGPRLAGALGTIRQPVVLATLLLGTVLFMIIFGVFLGIFAEHLETEFGYRPSVRGLILAAPALTATIAGLIVGRVRLKLGVRAIVYAALSGFAASLAIIGTAGVLPILLIGVFLYGFAEGSLIPTLQDIIATEAPENVRGAVMATWVGFVRLGQTLGPAIAGAMLGWFTTGEVIVGFAGFAVAVIVVTLAARPYRSMTQADVA